MKSMIRHMMLNRIANEPGWGALIGDVISKLLSEHFDRAYVETFGQFNERWNSITPEDAYSFALLHADAMQGKLCKFQIQVGCGPYANADVDENQNILNGLPYPFKGVFTPESGCSAQSDGTLEWTEPIVAPSYDADTNTFELVELPPGDLMLEVGTTRFLTSFVHIKYDMGIARWPYNHNYITCYAPIERGKRVTKDAYGQEWSMVGPSSITTATISSFR